MTTESRMFIILKALPSLLANFLLPWALYKLSRPHVDETQALMISAGVPSLWALAQFALKRRVDALSLLVVSGIALSLIAIALGGSPKILLFRESIITGLTGLVLVGSVLIGRPLFLVIMPPIVRAFLSPDSAMAAAIPRPVLARALTEWESIFTKLWFARAVAVLTMLTGLVAILETAVRGILIFTMPTERVLLVAPMVQYAGAGVIFAWSFLYFIPLIRRNAQLEKHQEIEDTSG